MWRCWGLQSSVWSQAGSGKSPGNRNGGVTGRGGLRGGNSRAQKCRRRKKGNNGAEKRERRVREITQTTRGEEDSRGEVRKDRREKGGKGCQGRDSKGRKEEKQRRWEFNKRTEDVRSGEACAESRRAEREGESKFSH